MFSASRTLAMIYQVHFFFFRLRKGVLIAESQGSWPLRQDLSRPLASLFLALGSIHVNSNPSVFNLGKEILKVRQFP